MSEQQPEPEGLTDEAISPDPSPDLQADPDERTDPDLANTPPGDDQESHPGSGDGAR
jgi:hypothetical protein